MPPLYIRVVRRSKENTPPSQLHAARLRLAERRMRGALLALKDASVHGASTRDQLRCEQIYLQTRASYGALAVVSPGATSAF
jgi:hypothetical protein